MTERQIRRLQRLVLSAFVFSLPSVALLWQESGQALALVFLGCIGYVAVFGGLWLPWFLRRQARRKQ